MADLQRIRQRLEQLLQKGEELLKTRHGSAPFYWVDGQLFRQWAVSSELFLKQVFGAESPHFAQFAQHCATNGFESARGGQAILRAAREDLEFGALSRIDDIVSGEIFSDFLEVAACLLSQGYKDPAASLVGAVLEDGLRRLARRNNVKVRDRDDISGLNSRLTEKGVYNSIVRGEVEAWSRVRNHADHGQFDEYDKDTVGRMLDGVRNFLAKFLA
jgi:hypothetical protein